LVKSKAAIRKRLSAASSLANNPYETAKLLTTYIDLVATQEFVAANGETTTVTSPGLVLVADVVC
jgi:hypothetical protein